MTNRSDDHLHRVLRAWSAPPADPSLCDRVWRIRSEETRPQSWFRWLTNATVFVPAPAAATAVLLLAGSIFGTAYLYTHPTERKEIVVQTREVPVTRDRFVTRIVYRNRVARATSRHQSAVVPAAGAFEPVADLEAHVIRSNGDAQ